MKTKKFAFSLIEFSILLFVIAVVFVAVTSGNIMIEKSRLVSARQITQGSPIKTTMTDVLAWYDATADNVLDTNGINITKWNDSSPNSLNFTTGSGQYLSSGINGLPVIKNANFTSSSYPLQLVTSVGVTITFVTNSSLMANNTAIFKKGVGDNDDFLLKTGNLPNYYLGISTTQQSWPKSNIDNIIGNKIITLSYLPNPSGFIKVYVNGSLVVNQSAVNFITNPNPSNLFYLGSATVYGEFIIYQRILSDSERKELHSYLGEKWKIKVTP